MAEKTEVNYQELSGLSKEFITNSDVTLNLAKITRTKTEGLRSSWIGKGSDAFFTEMHDDVLPAMERLKQALEEAAQTTNRISTIYSQAEEEASGSFKGIEPPVYTPYV